MQNKLIFAVGIVASLSLYRSTSFAEPPACKRWRTPITNCEALGREEPCTLFPWDEPNINKRIFASTGRAACARFVAIHAPGKRKRRVDPFTSGGSNGVYCYWDSDGDGNVEEGSYTIIWEEDLTPEPHCFCKVTNGPYRDLEWNGNIAPYEADRVQNRHDFPYALKKAVLAENLATSTSGGYTSDADNDPFEDLQKDDHLADDAAEIDHIIPRVDSQGCLCGDATPENAAVISRDLNGAMSNTPPKWDRDRAEMYKQFVTCDDPSVAEFKGPKYTGPLVAVEHFQTDETTYDIIPDDKVIRREAPVSDENSGGCSTGGGAGLLVALGFLGLRRRKVNA